MLSEGNEKPLRIADGHLRLAELAEMKLCSDSGYLYGMILKTDLP
jgi:hypothetical protein